MKKIFWTSEKRNVNDLIPAKYNPRYWPEKESDSLKKSLDKFNLADPLIINRNNTLIGGHFRLHILKSNGIQEVDVRVPSVNLNETQEKELNLRLNKNLGEWDIDLLANFDEEMLLDVGFESAELDKIFQLEPEAKDDEIPEDVPATTKLGDLYILGQHRLLCGDSTNVEDVERLMDGKKADMVFTDPPYQLDTKGGGVLKHAKSMRGIEDLNIGTFDPSCLKSLSTTEIFCCNKPLVKQYLQLADDWGKPYDICFYKKENTSPNYGGHLMTDTEYLIVIGNQAPRKGLPKETYSKAFIGKKDVGNKTAWSKPVALCTKFIQLYSDHRNIIGDWYLGSGSTLIACEKTNRICYGMEIDPKYCDVIVKRWEDYTNGKAQKIY